MELKSHKRISGLVWRYGKATIGPVAGAVLSTTTIIRDWIVVTGIPEAIGPLDSRPSMQGQLVWVVTVLRAVIGWSAC